MKLLLAFLLAVSAVPPRFRALPIVIDSEASLAAWQIEVLGADVVGIEGGEAPFSDPPYYDPEALTGGRLVLAAFSTTGALPPGAHRVATLQVRESGTPRYSVRLVAAADPSGTRATLQVRLEEAP